MHKKNAYRNGLVYDAFIHIILIFNLCGCASTQ